MGRRLPVSKSKDLHNELDLRLIGLGSGVGTATPSLDDFLDGKSGPRGQLRDIALVKEMSFAVRRKALDEYELTRDYQQLDVHFLRIPALGRIFFHNYYRYLYDKIQDLDSSSQHLFFELFPQLNLAPGPLALDQVAQVKALVGRYHQYHVRVTYLIAKIAEVLVWLQTRNFKSSSRLASRLKYSAINAICQRLEGMPYLSEWIDFVLSQMVMLRDDDDLAGLTVALPLWMGPDDAYGALPALVGDTGYSEYGSKYSRQPVIEEWNNNPSPYSVLNENNAGSVVRRPETDFVPNYSNNYGVIAEFMFSELNSLIDDFVDEFSGDMLVINGDLPRFYEKMGGVLNARFDLSDLGQRIRSMRPVDGPQYRERYMKLHNDVPRPIVRQTSENRAIGDFVMPHALKVPLLNASSETDPTQHHFDLTDEEYLDYCQAGHENAEHTEFVWPDCAEFPVMSYALSAGDVETAHDRNEFLTSFPGTDFGGGTLHGYNGLFGGIGLAADDASPDNYFKAFGKYAFVRNFKMLSNRGDRFVRKAGQAAAELKSNQNWYMLRRDFDQYGILRMIPFIIESKDPMDPFLCSQFHILSTEDVDKEMSWADWYTYQARTGHGFAASAKSIGGKSVSNPTAGDLVTGVSNTFASAWALWHAGIKDAIMLVGDNPSLNPMQQLAREDVARFGVGMGGAAATEGYSQIGGVVPYKPTTELTIGHASRYTEDSFPRVAEPTTLLPHNRRAIYVGPARVFYNIFSWINITLGDWGFLDNGSPGSDAALVQAIWPELISNVPTTLSHGVKQDVNLYLALARIWVPSLEPSRGRAILETLLDAPYEGFKRVIDMSHGAQEPTGFIAGHLSPPDVVPTRIDQAIQLVLKIVQTAPQRGVDGMPGAKFNDPSSSRGGGKSNYRDKGSSSHGGRGRSGKKPWKKRRYSSRDSKSFKTEDSKFDDKLKDSMGSAAPVKDEKPEFRATEYAEKGTSEK
jgi:hypothetical protein